MRIRLPRWDRNSPILHGQLNALAETAERADSLEVDGSSGLMLATAGGSKLLSFVLPDQVAAIQLVGQLPAGNGTLQCGKGSGSLLGFDPATGTLAADPSASPLDVFNLINVPIANGSTILAAQAYGQWFYLLTICGNGVTS